MGTMPPLPFFNSKDESVNQFQRRVIELFRSVWSFIFIPVYTTADRPVASEQWAGRFIRVRDTNSAEQLQFCLKNSNGAYGWAVVSISPQ